MTRLAVPGWYAPLSVALAVAAGVTLVGRPAGLGLSVLLLATLGAAAAATQPGDRWQRAWWLLAHALALVPTLRTAPWVQVLCVGGAGALALAAATGPRTWAQLAELPGRLLPDLLPGPLAITARLGGQASPAALRGVTLAAGLLVVFGSLFVASDRAFAALAEDVVPDLGDQLPLSLLVGTGMLVLAGGLPAAAAREFLPAGRPPARRLGRTETRIALGALCALIAAFVAVQAATLFGGDAFVRQTAGVTYAQHAREGFWLLLVVAGLTLAVVAAAARRAHADRALLGVLCGLTMVVLASAWQRLDLYVDAYGATRAREFAGWSIVFLAGVFALVVAWRPRALLPRVLITWAALLGVAFGLSDPDGRIAERAQDPAYVRQLSEDATGCTRERDLWSFNASC